MNKLSKAYSIFGAITFAGMAAHTVGFIFLFVGAREEERREVIEFVRSQKKGGTK